MPSTAPGVEIRMDYDACLGLKKPNRKVPLDLGVQSKECLAGRGRVQTEKSS